MKDEELLKGFKHNLFECLKKSHYKRNNIFKNKCENSFINEKSSAKKLLILFGEKIFNDGENYNNEIILKNINLTESAIKLLNESSENKINSDDFDKQFFGLSKEINFFYLFSRIYCKIFLNENEWYKIFINFLFQKEYEQNKDIINDICCLLGYFYNKKLNYEELLNIINENYIKENDIISEYVKIFMNNKIEYISIINNKLKITAKQNLLDLKLEKEKKENEEKAKVRKINLEQKNIICNINNNEEREKIINDNNVNNNNVNDVNNNNNVNNNVNINNDNNINNNINNNVNNNININNVYNDNIMNMNKENKIEINTKIINNVIESEQNINAKITDKIENNDKIDNGLNITKEEKNNNNSDITNTSTVDKLKNDLKTVKDYLYERLKYYESKGFDMSNSLLKYKLEKNENFSVSDISYLVNLSFNPDEKLNDKVLKDLLEKLELKNPVPDTKKYGYFCYKIKNGKIIESLYSIINPELLYDEITKVNEVDDFNNSNITIRKAYIESRGKSLEYYINKTVFEKQYHNRHYPRIIFPLRKIYKKYPFKYDFKFYECEKEIDGAFLLEHTFVINKNDFPFETQYYKSFACGLDYDKNNYDDMLYKFEKNDLLIIEIKTRFPNKYYDLNTGEKCFYDIVIDMFNKMFIFEQLFSDMGLGYNRIRLILFYDLIKIDKYQSELQKAYNAFKKSYRLHYFNKIYFQIIYMDSSYFAESLKTFQDKIDNINEKYKEIKNKNDILKIQNEKVLKDNTTIKNENVELKIQNEKILKDNTTIKNENIVLKNDNAELKIQNEKVLNDNITIKNENEQLKNDNDVLKIKIENVLNDNTIFKKENEELKVNNKNDKERNTKIIKILYENLDENKKKEIDDLL